MCFAETVHAINMWKCCATWNAIQCFALFKRIEVSRRLGFLVWNLISLGLFGGLLGRQHPPASLVASPAGRPRIAVICPPLIDKFLIRPASVVAELECDADGAVGAAPIGFDVEPVDRRLVRQPRACSYEVDRAPSNGGIARPPVSMYSPPQALVRIAAFERSVVD